MASIVTGFEYDIFISYRLKDNKGDHWVTEFVSALKSELESTFKEDISIYFDANPHDGLLETHNVDKSLKGKLKCLIFIPIISQTYCDQGAFAWQHEFCMFNKLSKEDQFGRDVKLSNGNVASRILPIRIHDLDLDDKTLLESELGETLRAVDFIYKEAGVNRPLTYTDSKTDNQNKTDYRNQVNKVANAIKELIRSLTSPARKITQAKVTHSVPSGKPISLSMKKIAIVSVGLIALFTTISLLVYKNYSSSKSLSPSLKTIAVIPFSNLSSEKEEEYFTDGVCNEILTQLSKIGSLHVISRTSMLQFKDTKKTMKEIGEVIGADVLLEGSVQKSNNKVHINVQLIDAKYDKQLWAETYDKDFKDIFSIQSDVAKSVALQLKTSITTSEKELIEKRPTQNIEAYNLYLKGNFEILKVTPEGLEVGLEMMNNATKLDPDFALPYLGIAYYYVAASDFYIAPSVAMPQLKIAVQTALAKDNTLADAHALYGNYETCYTWDWAAAQKQCAMAIQLEPNGNVGHLMYSLYLGSQGNLDEAILEGAKTVEIEPMSAEKGSFHALMYYYARRYDDALRELNRVSVFAPRFPIAHFVRGLCLSNQGKFANAIAEQKLANDELAAPWSYGRLAYAYARAGNRLQAIAILDSLRKQSRTQYVASDVVASVYVALGDKDHAFEYLEKALNERAGWLVFIKVDPVWDPIRNDARFIPILKRMGLDG